MAFCTNCGHQLADGAKFCYECGAKTSAHTVPQEERRRIVYDGEIHKCPNCGEVLGSFTSTCPSCGFELRSVKASSAIREFTNKLERIEANRKEDGQGGLFSSNNNTTLSKTDEQKISLIQSFPIPNTKEDLMEFFLLAYSNINAERYNEYSSISLSQEAVSDAWAAKAAQAYEKAQLCFGNTHEFRRIQEISQKKNSEVKKSKQKDKRNFYRIILIGVVFIAVLLVLLYFMISSDKRKIESENARLELIVEDVYDAIEAEDYLLARKLVTKINFSASTITVYGDQARENWENTKKELLQTIDAAEASQQTGG